MKIIERLERIYNLDEELVWWIPYWIMGTAIFIFIIGMYYIR